MRYALVLLATTIAAISLLVGACAPATPAAAPTQISAAPTKVAEPTKAAATQPTPVPTKAAEPTKVVATQTTAVPAKKTDFPIKGKTITMIIPFGAGADIDLQGRMVAAGLEKYFGTPVQVLNRVGAAGQVGVTEIALAKPDGSTFGYTTIPSTIGMYMDPERKAEFNRSNFKPVALHVDEPSVVGVPADSPYKTLKDFVDAAKAKPDKITSGYAGILGPSHLVILEFERLSGVKTAPVLFNDTISEMTALLGGHIEVGFSVVSAYRDLVRNGQARVLAVANKDGSPFLPGVKTMQAEGYPVYMSTIRLFSLPANTPQEIVDVYDSAFGSVMADEEVKKKSFEAGWSLRYMNSKQTEAYWAEVEATVKPLMTAYMSKR